MVEFANRAYHNRRLPRPAKEQDSSRSHFPQWQTRTLFTPALSLCPPSKNVYSWQLLFCRPSRKQNNNYWMLTSPFLINMQKYAILHSNLKRHTGTALPCRGKISAVLKVYNQPLLPRGICKTGMFGTTFTEQFISCKLSPTLVPRAGWGSNLSCWAKMSTGNKNKGK